MTILQYHPNMVIRNLGSLSHGTGAKYLEVIEGQDKALIAKRWRRSPIAPEGSILIKF